ncbi:hypothetical protein PMAYCL1PPCAC_32614, partial [Pristionchus mayeri]
FIIVPLLMCFIQLELRCFPFLVPLLAMFILPIHPILHNLILLFVIPTYRRAIAKFFLKLTKIRIHQTPSISYVIAVH